jgi:biopolymer transport protein ExbD
MARTHHYRRKKETPELDVTTFLNLMVVLIPFLLITAVFSRITIQELNLPEATAGGEKPDKPLVTIEVIVRENAIEIGDGRNVVARFPKTGDRHDYEALSEAMIRLKARYAAKEDAVILIEPDVSYEEVIRVMDTIKVAMVRESDDDKPRRLVLFPELSIGDAP